jgi:hypothetical protein
MNHMGIIFIGTGKYIRFFPRYYETVRERFLPSAQKTFFVFTDRLDAPFVDSRSVKVYPTEHMEWPYVTLLRFRIINRAAPELAQTDAVVFLDADMFVNHLIAADEFMSHGKPLFGVAHPGYTRRGLLRRLLGKAKGTFETNEASLAAVKRSDDLSTYWQGCFWGGRTERTLQMVSELERRVDDDLQRGVIAVWHDESHLNKYFIEHRDEVHTFHPGYAYPELWSIPYPKMIVHIAKDNKSLHT